jgi:hypothetical protein
MEPGRNFPLRKGTLLTCISWRNAIANPQLNLYFTSPAEALVSMFREAVVAPFELTIGQANAVAQNTDTNDDLYLNTFYLTEDIIINPMPDSRLARELAEDPTLNEVRAAIQTDCDSVPDKMGYVVPYQATIFYPGKPLDSPIPGRRGPLPGAATIRARITTYIVCRPNILLHAQSFRISKFLLNNVIVRLIADWNEENPKSRIGGGVIIDLLANRLKRGIQEADTGRPQLLEPVFVQPEVPGLVTSPIQYDPPDPGMSPIAKLPVSAEEEFVRSPIFPITPEPARRPVVPPSSMLNPADPSTFVPQRMSPGDTTALDAFASVPGDVVRVIALGMTLDAISKTCLTSRRFNELICNSEDFWRLRVQQDFGRRFSQDKDEQIDEATRKKPANWTWKRYYAELSGNIPASQALDFANQLAELPDVVEQLKHLPRDQYQARVNEMRHQAGLGPVNFGPALHIAQEGLNAFNRAGDEADVGIRAPGQRRLRLQPRNIFGMRPVVGGGVLRPVVEENPNVDGELEPPGGPLRRNFPVYGRDIMNQGLQRREQYMNLWRLRQAFQEFPPTPAVIGEATRILADLRAIAEQTGQTPLEIFDREMAAINGYPEFRQEFPLEAQAIVRGLIGGVDNQRRERAQVPNVRVPGALLDRGDGHDLLRQIRRDRRTMEVYQRLVQLLQRPPGPQVRPPNGLLHAIVEHLLERPGNVIQNLEVDFADMRAHYPQEWHNQDEAVIRGAVENYIVQQQRNQARAGVNMGFDPVAARPPNLPELQARGRVFRQAPPDRRLVIYQAIVRSLDNDPREVDPVVRRAVRWLLEQGGSAQRNLENDFRYLRETFPQQWNRNDEDRIRPLILAVLGEIEVDRRVQQGRVLAVNANFDGDEFQMQPPFPQPNRAGFNMDFDGDNVQAHVLVPGQPEPFQPVIRENQGANNRRGYFEWVRGAFGDILGNDPRARRRTIARIVQDAGLPEEQAVEVFDILFNTIRQDDPDLLQDLTPAEIANLRNSFIEYVRQNIHGVQREVVEDYGQLARAIPHGDQEAIQAIINGIYRSAARRNPGRIVMDQVIAELAEIDQHPEITRDWPPFAMQQIRRAMLQYPPPDYILRNQAQIQEGRVGGMGPHPPQPLLRAIDVLNPPQNVVDAYRTFAELAYNARGQSPEEYERLKRQFFERIIAQVGGQRGPPAIELFQALVDEVLQYPRYRADIGEYVQGLLNEFQIYVNRPLDGMNRVLIEEARQYMPGFQQLINRPDLIEDPNRTAEFFETLHAAFGRIYTEAGEQQQDPVETLTSILQRVSQLPGWNHNNDLIIMRIFQRQYLPLVRGLGELIALFREVINDRNPKMDAELRHRVFEAVSQFLRQNHLNRRWAFGAIYMLLRIFPELHELNGGVLWRPQIDEQLLDRKL